MRSFVVCGLRFGSGRLLASGSMNPFTSLNPLSAGLTRAFRGLRTGDPQLILMGAALLAYAWLHNRPTGKELIFRRKLKAGEGVQVRLRQPDGTQTR